jgi:hypothetical protein
MLAQKEYDKVFKGLQVMVCDEWHELLGTKRGVQVELGLSRLKGLGAEMLERGADTEKCYCRSVNFAHQPTPHMGYQRNHWQSGAGR